MRRHPVVATLLVLAGCAGVTNRGPDGPGPSMVADQSTLIRLWAEGTPAFGVFVPSERERGARGPDGERLPALYTAAGGAELGANQLLDYLFLNLEGSYDAAAVSEIAAGLERAGSDMTLLVRIPPISADGADAARARVGSLVERMGQPVMVLMGSDHNIKITKPSDLPLARLFLAQEKEQGESR